MNNQSTTDENDALHNPRPVNSELLTKIYYPDTLYPDTYTFFADRRGASRVRSPPMNEPSTIPKQATNEIEINERQNKSPVSTVIFDKLSGVKSITQADL